MVKVLYVEHNEDNLYMLKTRLELLGDFEVLAAEDSEKGCKLAVTERPDVILMDLERPALGIRATPQERSANPRHSDHRHVRICTNQRARAGHCHGALSPQDERFDV